MAFEAEVCGGSFVSFRVKNHSEKCHSLSELCLEVWGVTTPGKAAIPDKSEDLALNTSSKGPPDLFQRPKGPTDRLGHRQAHYLGHKYK